MTSPTRRTFLRQAGVALGLPLLNSLAPRRGFGQGAPSGDVRRLLAICAPLGIHTPYLFPEKAGRDYAATPYLEPLQPLRDKFTVISGLMHPDVDGGHSAEMSYLTGAAHPGQPSFRNSISLDQFAAERIGHLTRVPSLALSANDTSLSYTRAGVRLPPENRPSRLFAKLFLDGTEAEKAKQVTDLKRGRSILDTVGGEAKKLHAELGKRDQEKLDEYLSSVRDLENRLRETGSWIDKPKPKVDAKPPTDITDRNDAIGRQRLMYDLMALALQTDSTRIITYKLGGLNSVPTIQGVTQDWHQLSHHGQDEKKIDELKLIEMAEFKAFGDFLGRLKGIQENDRSLLDGTTVLYGSNLGNASSHSWRNLPLVLAGGGFRHGQHLAHDKDDNTAFANLFVQVAQNLGLEMESFGSSTAQKIDGLELA
ncbi:MAG: DUF1552 domain-containing protein [Verrucomicrobiae bacterium]|nr:DUF1552 domain-containing protein [Verrucomicrobiae bacterium]